MTYKFLEPFRFGNGLTLRNKVVMAPTTTMASFYNGMITKDEIDFYSARSGGVGMVITEVAYVSEGGKGFEGELSAASDDMIPGLRNLAFAIKKNGAKAVLQIFHVGRKMFSKTLRGVQPVSASAIKSVHPADAETPRALREEEIEEIIRDFGEATRRAILAGFDGVELHGANTYLLQQFYSPNSNQRTDKWGGDREKRMTFAKEVIAEVRKVIKEYGDENFFWDIVFLPKKSICRAFFWKILCIL